MKNKGFCVVRTEKNNVVNVYAIATFDFMSNDEKGYCFKNCYHCDSFEIFENVGGDVIIELYHKMKHSGVEIITALTFEKDTVENIRIEDSIKG